MANTFTKVYKKTANNGNAEDYTLIAQVGVGGVPLQVMAGATSSSPGVQGLVPAPTSAQREMFLRGDGTWTAPPASTYANVSTAAAGLAPQITSTSGFLKGDGTWATPTNTTYSTTGSITSGSSALLTSGGVYTKLGVSSTENFTINGTTYATVAAAISALNSN